MIEKKAFSVCSLDVDGHQELGSFVKRLLALESSVQRVLDTLGLQSDVEIRPECDASRNKFGLSIWLKEAKQRNFLKQMDPTLPSNYVDAEVKLVLERFQDLLTQVNRQFSGVAASNFVAEDVGNRTLSVGELMRVCKKLEFARSLRPTTTKQKFKALAALHGLPTFGPSALASPAMRFRSWLPCPSKWAMIARIFVSLTPRV
jgi:hypothetical protein